MVCGLGALSGKSFGWNGGLLAESWPDRLLSYLAVGGWRLAAGGWRLAVGGRRDAWSNGHSRQAHLWGERPTGVVTERKEALVYFRSITLRACRFLLELKLLLEPISMRSEEPIVGPVLIARLIKLNGVGGVGWLRGARLANELKPVSERRACNRRPSSAELQAAASGRCGWARQLAARPS